MLRTKTLKIVVFTLLTATLLMTALSLSLPSVKGTTSSTVVMYSSVGGTTSPVAGTYTNYTSGATATFTANAGYGFLFKAWIVVTAAGAATYTVNPLVINLNESEYAIQVEFTGITAISPVTPSTVSASTNAIVVILAGNGGTTSPAPGTYSLANATSLDITATPDSGFTFAYWVISGSPLNGHGGYSYTLTPTNNPYNVNHGYGNTYNYQPVFLPTSTTVSTTPPTPKINEFSTATIIIALMALVIVAFGTYAYTKKAKK
ncbi:MAG: hypothetical protein ABSD42_04945 [Candidatus Bathyarchaeia archaeon]